MPDNFDFEIADDDDMFRALRRIDTDCKGKPRPVSGTVECPRCGKPMKYWVGGPRAMSADCEDHDCMHLRG